MKFALVIISILFTAAPAFSAEKWSYKAFPYVASNNPLKAQQKRILKLGKTELRALMTRTSGTHRFWGVEQVYSTRNLKKRIFVKYGVKLSSDSPLGSWLKIGKGQLLHLKKDNSIVAYFAQGLNNVELFEAQKHFLNEGGRSVSILEMFNPITCAYADEVTSGNDQPASAPQGNFGDQAMAFMARAGNVIGCIGQETLNNAWASGQELIKNANWDNFVKGAQDMGAAALDAIPTVDEALGGIQAAGDFVFKTAQDPVGAWNAVGNQFDQTTKMVAGVYQEVTKAVDGFSQLDPEIQDRIVCDTLAYLGGEALLGVALGATGAGAGLGAAKVLLAIGRYAAKIKPIMSVLHHLGQLKDLGKDKMMALVDRLLKGQVKDDELAALKAQAAHTAENNISAENEQIKALGNAERQQMLKASGQLNDSQRIDAAGSSLGRSLTAEQKRALIAAHNVAADKGYGQYSPTELRQKMQLLTNAGFSPKEAELLMRKGLAGNQAMVSAEVKQKGIGNVKNDAAAPSINTLSTSKEMFSSTQNGYGLLKKGDAAANAEFSEASSKGLSIAKQLEFERPDMAAANLKRSIDLPAPVTQANLNQTVDLARRLDIYKDVTTERFEQAYSRDDNKSLFMYDNFGKADEYQKVVQKYNNLTIMSHMWDDGYRVPGGPDRYQIREMLQTYKGLLDRYKSSIFKP